MHLATLRCSYVKSLRQRQLQRSTACTRALERPWTSRLPPRRFELDQLLHDAVTALALPAEPSQQELQRWSRSLDVLCDVHGPTGAERVRRTVLANPELLAADLELWHSFLVSGFRLPPDGFAKLAADCPSLLTAGDVFGPGCVMLFFKAMGWTNTHITQRIIGYYPQLLMLDRVRDMEPVLRHLAACNCTGENLRLLLWEYPRIFERDYRRHVRKFQHLGVYGLSLRSAPAVAAEAEAYDTEELLWHRGGGGGGREGRLEPAPLLPVELEWR